MPKRILKDDAALERNAYERASKLSYKDLNDALNSVSDKRWEAYDRLAKVNDYYNKRARPERGKTTTFTMAQIRRRAKEIAEGLYNNTKSEERGVSAVYNKHPQTIARINEYKRQHEAAQREADERIRLANELYAWRKAHGYGPNDPLPQNAFDEDYEERTPGFLERIVSGIGSLFGGSRKTVGGVGG